MGNQQYCVLSVSFGVCHGLGADFRRKSEIRMPALWGRKAGTDRVLSSLLEGVNWLVPSCARPTRAF
jgi:hypothetical protein